MIESNDELLAARFAAIANPLDDADWKDVLGRASAQPSRAALFAVTRAGGSRHTGARRIVVVATAVIVLLAVGVAVAASVSGWGIATRPQTTVTESGPQAPVGPGDVATPSGDAVKESGIFDNAALGGQTVPNDVQTAMTRCGWCRSVQRDAARRVAQQGASALYAAPTVTGAVCYWLDNGGEIGGSCAPDLTESRPVSMSSTQTSSGNTVVAGIVRKDATQVIVHSQTGSSCVATLGLHAFICDLKGTLEANGVLTVEVTLGSGKTVVLPL
jgi:hypothetical protein